MEPPLTPRIPIAATMLLVASAAGAATCDEVRAGIEAKVRASGATQYTLTTVDVQAQAPGKVVGTCDLGARKIMYLQTPGAASAPRTERVITECKDGTVSVGGDCKKPASPSR
jgi:hypothetical protein